MTDKKEFSLADAAKAAKCTQGDVFAFKDHGDHVNVVVSEEVKRNKEGDLIKGGKTYRVTVQK